MYHQAPPSSLSYKRPRGQEEEQQVCVNASSPASKPCRSGHLPLPDILAVAISQLTSRLISGEAAIPPANENPCSYCRSGIT